MPNDRGELHKRFCSYNTKREVVQPRESPNIDRMVPSWTVTYVNKRSLKIHLFIWDLKYRTKKQETK